LKIKLWLAFWKTYGWKTQKRGQCERNGNLFTMLLKQTVNWILQQRPALQYWWT
jgi:hypothetical protein